MQPAAFCFYIQGFAGDIVAMDACMTLSCAAHGQVKPRRAAQLHYPEASPEHGKKALRNCPVV